MVGVQVAVTGPLPQQATRGPLPDLDAEALGRPEPTDARLAARSAPSLPRRAGVVVLQHPVGGRDDRRRARRSSRLRDSDAWTARCIASEVNPSTGTPTGIGVAASVYTVRKAMRSQLSSTCGRRDAACVRRRRSARGGAWQRQRWQRRGCDEEGGREDRCGQQGAGASDEVHGPPRRRCRYLPPWYGPVTSMRPFAFSANLSVAYRAACRAGRTAGASPLAARPRPRAGW